MKYPTFEDWLAHLKKENPNLQWETMDLTELRETYETGIHGKEINETGE